MLRLPEANNDPRSVVISLGVVRIKPIGRPGNPGQDPAIAHAGSVRHQHRQVRHSQHVTHRAAKHQLADSGIEVGALEQ